MSTFREPSDLSNPPNYSFPSHRLSRILRNPQKHPIVLVACGSFSPVTYLHLRMFEMAKDYVRQNTDYEIVGGYLSPVSDKYKKPGLLNAHHRYVLFGFLVSPACTVFSTHTQSIVFIYWVAHHTFKSILTPIPGIILPHRAIEEGTSILAREGGCAHLLLFLKNLLFPNKKGADVLFTQIDYVHFSC
jgi:Cytidylyltransferase-like